MSWVAILKGVLFVVEALCSLLLIGLILIQKPKGGGLGMAFGGGMGESLFGSRTGNVLTKATIILSIVFMINTVALAIVFARHQGGAATLMDRAAPPPAAAPLPSPVGAPGVTPLLPSDGPVETAPIAP